MLILLPPSEGKTPAPAHRESLDFSLLHHPGLNTARRQVLDALAQVSIQENALEQLKVGRSLVAEVERNTRLLDEPATDAAQIYSGVLYEALDYVSLSSAEQLKADEHILVISALWGAVRLDDIIPAYRLSMGISLGQLGSLAKYWKEHLNAELQTSTAGELIIDCRSAAYQKAFPTAPQQTYEVKALDAETRKVISHMAKRYRGLVVRALIQDGLIETQSIDEVIERLSRRFTLELTEPTARKAGVITVLV